MELIALTAISPIDGRYRKTTESLADYFSEFGNILNIMVVSPAVASLINGMVVIDLTDDGLGAAERGLQRLMETFENLMSLKGPDTAKDGTLIKELTEGVAAIENEMVDRRHSDARFGRLWRLLKPGKHQVIVSGTCH